MARTPHKYMAQEVSDEERSATFSARHSTLDQILTGLREQACADKLKGFLLTGPRGAGKSTLVHMTRQRIAEDEALRSAWQPVILPEELPYVLTLRDLWVAILEHLYDDKNPGLKPALDQCRDEASEDKSERLAVQSLRQYTQSTSRRLVIALENFSDLLETLSSQELTRLARQLKTEPFALLLATSVGELDFSSPPAKPFRDLLTPLPLGRLTSDEVQLMLQQRGEREGNRIFLTKKDTLTGIIAAISRLTGGNPRLVVMLYEVITVSKIDTAVGVLRQLIDELTPLYDGLLRRLSPQQRKIVDAVMKSGGQAVTPAEIAKEARIDVLTVRTQLARLRESSCVSLEGGGKGREAYYSVTDRLLATWYQMRYFAPNRRRIEMFVEVLREWFRDRKSVV